MVPALSSDPHSLKKNAYGKIIFQQVVRRFANFIRPQPRYIPLSIEQITKNQQSLTTVEQFNDLYYSSGISGDLNWQGMQMIKNPCDLWIVLELFQKLKPVAVIETGTHMGGSATFYADMLKVLSIDCEVITIDINPKWSFDPRSKNIFSVVGYSIAPDVVHKVEDKIRSIQSHRLGHVLVFLDSDHSEKNVLAEMELYQKFVTLGSYLVVEDTNVNGHPSAPQHGPGPFEAVQKFLSFNADFEIDFQCQKHLLTFNPSGWLKRTQPYKAKG